MYNWIQFVILLASIPAAVMVGYLLCLTLAAIRAPRGTPSWLGFPRQRFLILIPAHNEDRLLPALLASVRVLDYPAELVAIHVVADNCTDQTAAVARAAGATVHERRDPAQAGKGQALNWLLERLPQARQPDTAVVFLDADSVVSPNFLRVMAARLERGQLAIQAYYAVRDPERSPAAGLRFAALAALHYLRPQGRMVLGTSAGLKGNGMVFAAGLLPQVRWTTNVTEDIEQHMALLLDGVRVRFAPDAVVWGEMPDTLAGSRSQHDRWERGRLQMARRYVPRLLGTAARCAVSRRYRMTLVLVDAALEHLIPPFSVLVAYSLALFGAAVIGAGLQAVSGGLPGDLGGFLPALSLGLTAALLAGQALYVLAALFLVRAPRFVYRQLLYAPGYLVWKLGQYVRAWLAKAEARWVRTTRNEVRAGVAVQPERGKH
jgi:cellulose synthase/poly-beta-1,6-N-acetylglucosamine synthase-like glycosyltransferase